MSIFVHVHVCHYKVPHLLELKKSPSVLFAGIDQPDDFVNLTHQELFGKGGFVVIDGSGVNKLTLGNISTFCFISVFMWLSLCKLA